jgi:hypothetical protein
VSKASVDWIHLGVIKFSECQSLLLGLENFVIDVYKSNRDTVEDGKLHSSQ